MDVFLGDLCSNVLVSHCDVDGSFLIHHFVREFLRNSSYKVVFVGLCQTFTHYNAAAQKMGLALTKACEREQLVFIDCLSHSATAGEHETVGTIEIEKGRWTLPLDMPHPLQILGHLIASQLDQHVEEKSRRNVIIIDELLVLLTVDINSSDLIGFLICCEELTQCNLTQQGSLVSFLRCDSDVDDQEAKSLLLHLQHRCNLHIQLCGLNTGYSQLVHGNIVVQRNDPVQIEPGNSHRNEMQYKVLDKDISIFPRGMA